MVSEVIRIFDRQNIVNDLQWSDCRRFSVPLVGVSSGFPQRERTAYRVVGIVSYVLVKELVVQLSIKVIFVQVKIHWKSLNCNTRQF
jgi:hypothetical protein